MRVEKLPPFEEVVAEYRAKALERLEYLRYEKDRIDRTYGADAWSAYVRLADEIADVLINLNRANKALDYNWRDAW